MDKLMKYINSHSSTYGVNIFYSTPSIYTKAVNDAGLVWDVKTDDFFPYGDGPHAIWSGYFTSRAPLKGYVRTRMNLSHAFDQILTTSALPDYVIDYKKQIERMTRFGKIFTISQSKIEKKKEILFILFKNR
jgi:hypothetical protein